MGDVARAAGLHLNELMASNVLAHPGPDGEYDDWIELCNAGKAAVDLSGWVLADENDGHRFELPAGTVIPPAGYLVAVRDVEAFTRHHPRVEALVGGVRFGFGGNDAVRLFDGGGDLVDVVVYDYLGQRVAQRQEPWLLPPGPHRLDFSPSGLAAGIYVYEVQFTSLAGKRLRRTGKFAVTP